MSIALHTRMSIRLGSLLDFAQARYVIHLSDGKRLVLFRLPSIEPSSTSVPRTNETQDGWSYYAMEAECPHAGGPMEESHVDIEDSAYVVSCPWHAYDFNVETGESSVGIKTCTFPIDIKDQVVYLQYNVKDGGVGDVVLSKVESVSEKVMLKNREKRVKRKKKQPASPVSTSTNDVISHTTSEDMEEEEEEEGLDAYSIPHYLEEHATFCDWAVHILNTANPEHKIELTTHFFSLFAQKENSPTLMPLGRGTVTPPDQPPRPESLSEVNPWEAPKPGRGGNLKSRITMLHALANIELWAIDLAIDICVRFSTFRTNTESKRELPRTFFHDFLKVAADEAKHFSLLRTRLEQLGSRFGALPVHHGLWLSATETAHDIRARISIIALVHEARGLDVNPMTIQKFRNAGDMESVATLEIIHNDEITHVTTGHRWLTWICEQEGADAVQVFRENVKKHFKGALKGPFNEEDRAKAGMDRRWYGERDNSGSPTVAVMAS
ncbi:Rieske domain-containing protein [Histoplasma capsulatum var. duboisii H88]|uniref:Rieske domain-containing protein n=2 Tax=Ajellomyces capsulatus (strain H88) TaxID=544711 RepID=A0A8A1LVJ3_AJEC8|nr:Rieske domain-containing protein [Histoplasma capsulatum var. duboisii H88]